MFRNNLPYKLLALAVAITLWFYVNSERNPQSRKTLNVPVVVENAPDNFIYSIKPAEARIVVHGPKDTVEDIRGNDIKCWVDLKGYQPADQSARKSFPIKIRISGGVDETIDYSTSPKTAAISLEMLATKKLPVEVKYLAPPPIGHSFSTPLFTPGKLNVSGAVSKVRDVDRLVVVLASHTGENRLDDYYPVTPVDNKGNPVEGVKLEKDKVRMQIDLIENPVQKSVIVSANIVGEPTFPARVSEVSISPQTITLKGRPKALMDVSTVSTEKIDISDITKTFSRDVSLKLPPGVAVAGSATTVRVQVQVETVETQSE